MTTRTREILLNAADLIEKQGWAHKDNEPGYCAWTAIVQMSEKRVDESIACSALKHQIGVSSPHLGGIWNWNDAPERTKEEVVAALRGAAEAELVPA